MIVIIIITETIKASIITKTSVELKVGLAVVAKKIYFNLINI